VIGQEHEHIAPHPFCSYMYPAQLPPHGPLPLGEMDPNTFSTPGGSRSYQHHHQDQGGYEQQGYDHDHDEGEDEISPAFSERMLKELASPSLIDPDLEDEALDLEVDQDQEDEYKPLKAKKGKGKATGGKKGRGKAKKGKGKAKAKPKITAASRRRTTVRGEARPTTTSKTYPEDDDTPYEARDTDSHIDVAYFPNLRNITYPLLAPPPGTHLDVNDLLILHPPALSSSDESHVPVNQYNKGNPPQGSRWEMYTCRGCRKTYDGKNARSVARRHLQDKHGIPLSQQARRTRWDMGKFRAMRQSMS